MAKDYKRRIVLNYKYDEVTAGTTNVKAQMRLLNAELKASQAEAKAFGTASDTLAVKQQSLNEKIKLVNSQLSQHKERLKQAEAKDNAKSVENYSNKINLAEAELRQLNGELVSVTKELKDQQGALTEAEKKMSEFAGKVGEVGKSLTRNITAPVLAAGGLAFKMAADYEQALGKMEVVFEQNSREIETWASNALADFGLARSSAVGMASDFGALFKGMGFTINQTAEWSKTLTERVMDLSNFYDTTTSETVNALNAIVTGQTEPLRKFGINMTQAALQEYAYSQNIRKKIADMTEAEKVQLRYNFVMEKTTIAVGTTARESESASAQMKKLVEVGKELGVSFGDVLLPVLVPFLEGINNILIGFNNLDDGTKELIVKLLLFAATIGPILSIFSGMIKMASGVSDGLKAVKGGLEFVKEAGGLMSAASSATQSFGMVKLIGYALALAAALLAVAVALDLIFNKGKGTTGVLDGIGNLFNGNTNNLNRQVQNSVNNASIKGYAVGSKYIEEDQLAFIHKGEAVIPANQNPYNPNNRGTGFGGDTFIFNVKADEIGEIQQLIEKAKREKQIRNAGWVPA